MENGNYTYRSAEELESAHEPLSSTLSENSKQSKGFKSRVAQFQRWISNGSFGRKSSSASSAASLDLATDQDIENTPKAKPKPSQASLSASLGAGIQTVGCVQIYPILSDNHASGSPSSLQRTSNWRHTLPVTPSSVKENSSMFSASPASSLVKKLNRLAERHTSPPPFQWQSPSGPSSDAVFDASTISPRSSRETISNLKGMLAPQSGSQMMDEENQPSSASRKRSIDELNGVGSDNEERVSITSYVDEEGIRVRCMDLGSRHSEVGFQSLPWQVQQKAEKAGFVFNVMILGETGIGKSTLISSLFNKNFELPPGEYNLDRVILDKHAFDLEEGAVKLQLNVIESKGYGDQLDVTNSWQGIMEFIDQQYEAYFQEENQVARHLRDYKDGRVHVCLFLLAPTASSVRALDLECMRGLAGKVNLIPIIARADSLTEKEVVSFKQKVIDELRRNNITAYKFPEDDDTVAEQNQRMNAVMPFAVVGSSEVIEITPGHYIRARVYPWGKVNIENDGHCDFGRFREALLRVNMYDLMLTTHEVLYEAYRDRRMTELGYGNKRNNSFIDTMDELRTEKEQFFRQMEKETRETFILKVREKEAEMKERERELNNQLETHRVEHLDQILDIDTQRAAMQKEMELFHRVRSEIVNSPTGTSKSKKK